MTEPLSTAAAGGFVARPMPDALLELLHGLPQRYAAVRPISTIEGDAYPETTVGDVRRVALLASRLLCHPRFDFAQIADARSAWRDALARVATSSALDWEDRYADNVGFWLRDLRALLQRLDAVLARRNAIRDTPRGPLVIGADLGLREIWDDLRHWYSERRIVRRRRGLRYPETTVADVRHVAATLTARAGLDSSRTMAQSVVESGLGARFLSPLMRDVDGRQPPLRARWNDVVQRWGEVLDRIDHLTRDRSDDDTYPDNARFWLLDAKPFVDEIAAIDRLIGGGR